MATSNASITLYSFHGCPYAHRAHIALAELGLKYDEVAIDLSRPREPWYLKINPRGLVPSLTYKHPALGATGHTFTESGVLIQFLCDMHPSHLLPASNTPMGALFRARLNFFVDTWNTKVGTLMFAMYKAAKDEEKEAIAREWVSAVEKEIEPLLKDAGPFFGGQSRMTLAEVFIAPFLLRIWSLAEAGIIPVSVKRGLEALPNFSTWAHTVMKQQSVQAIWDPENCVKLTAERLQKMRMAAANGGGANRMMHK